MSDIDDLLAELTHPRPDPTPPEGPSVPGAETAERRRPWIWWLAAGLALLVVLLGGLAALADDGDESTTSDTGERPTAAAVVSATTTAEPTVTPTVAAPAGPAATIGSSPVDPTQPPPDEVEAPAATTAAENPQGAVRYVTISGGQVTLRGQAPTRAVGDALVATLATATGGSVVDQLAIVPGSPADTGVAVYLPDRLLFDLNSIEVGSGDLGQLDLTARLLAAFPDLTVRVVARTDAKGSYDLNLQVANLRATAVCNYLLSVGASPSQIELDPVGEADEPHDEAADIDADTDRHVELVIEGTLRG